jgi:hypothetical protein
MQRQFADQLHRTDFLTFGAPEDGDAQTQRIDIPRP